MTTTKAPNPIRQLADQSPNKHQAQISKLFKSLNFGYCNLFRICNFEF